MNDFLQLLKAGELIDKLCVQFMMVQGSKSRVRRDEMRIIVAHIYRLVAADLKPGVLQEDGLMRSKTVDWIVDTLKYLQSAATGQCTTSHTTICHAYMGCDQQC